MPKLISNPPFNLSWQGSETVPASSANFAFVEKALDLADHAAFIFPNSVLTTSNPKEMEFKKRLIENGWLESVVLCPEKMFESTSIGVCLLTVDRTKKDQNVVFVNAARFCDQEVRDQKGQFGDNSKTQRVYHKTLNAFSLEQIETIVETVKERREIEGFSAVADKESIQANDWNLSPNRYIQTSQEIHFRSFDDIIDDLNRTIEHKNINKLTINVTTAKELGLETIRELVEQSKELTTQINEILEPITARRIIKPDYYTETRSKVLKFENMSKTEVSESFTILLSMWKQHIMYLNNEENRYMTELKDKLLKSLLSGEISI